MAGTKKGMELTENSERPEISDAIHNPRTIIDLATLPCTTLVTRATNTHYSLLIYFGDIIYVDMREYSDRSRMYYVLIISLVLGYYVLVYGLSS